MNVTDKYTVHTKKYSLEDITGYLLSRISYQEALNLLNMPLRAFGERTAMELYFDKKTDYSPEIMATLKRILE